MPYVRFLFHTNNLCLAAPDNIAMPLHTQQSQLDGIVEHPNLLAGLERRKANIWAAIASESITERAVSAAADFALDGKIDFSQVICAELHRVERVVGRCSLLCVLCLNLLLQAA